MDLLTSVRIQSPCTVDWNTMTGDEQSRHCGLCNLKVYNLSAMSRAEVETLLQSHGGGRLCVRYFQRPDGTVMTADCLSVRARYQKKARLVRQLTAGQTIVASVLMVTLIGLFTTRVASAETSLPVNEPSTITVTPTFEQPKALGPLLITPPEPPPVIMGGIRPMPSEPTAMEKPPLKPCKTKKVNRTPHPKPPVIMGKMAPPKNLNKTH